MFITSGGFKRLINEAYKGAGLKIGNDGTGYYLAGGYWAMWIEKGCIPKKELGAIIELTGELPEAGKRIPGDKIREPVRNAGQPVLQGSWKTQASARMYWK